MVAVTNLGMNHFYLIVKYIVISMGDIMELKSSIYFFVTKYFYTTAQKCLTTEVELHTYLLMAPAGGTPHGSSRLSDQPSA